MNPHSLLVLIGASLCASPAEAQDKNLSIEQRIQKIVEWVKVNPTTVDESNDASSEYCSSSDAISSRVSFKDGDKTFILRYCDDGERGKIEAEDLLMTTMYFPVKTRWGQSGKIISQIRNTIFYDGGLNGFHPEIDEWLISEIGGVGSSHKECVKGWLGTEYVKHLDLSGTTLNPEQDRKERKKVQEQYLLVLDQIEAYIGKSTNSIR